MAISCNMKQMMIRQFIAYVSWKKSEECVTLSAGLERMSMNKVYKTTTKPKRIEDGKKKK